MLPQALANCPLKWVSASKRSTILGNVAHVAQVSGALVVALKELLVCGLLQSHTQTHTNIYTHTRARADLALTHLFTQRTNLNLFTHAVR